MKIAPSKVLLVASLATYGYWLRGQFTDSSKLAAAAAATGTTELSPAVVNRVVAFTCDRDPFTGVAIRPGDKKSVAAKRDLPVKPLGPMALQGVAVGSEIRSAIINGKTVKEGETESVEPGTPTICAKTIGADYAIVRTGGNDVVLRLEKPKSQTEFEQAAAKPKPGDQKKSSIVTLPMEAR
jgi:hypothetical protein